MQDLFGVLQIQQCTIQLYQVFVDEQYIRSRKGHMSESAVKKSSIFRKSIQFKMCVKCSNHFWIISLHSVFMLQKGNKPFYTHFNQFFCFASFYFILVPRLRVRRTLDHLKLYRYDLSGYTTVVKSQLNYSTSTIKI